MKKDKVSAKNRNINKNQMEMLDLKYTITEAKVSVDELNSRMERTEEISSELEDSTI